MQRFLIKVPDRLGWTRGSTRCRIPDVLSNHGKGKKNIWPKGDRELGKQDSERVLQKTGVFIAVGSGKIVYNIFLHASILIYNTNFLLLCVLPYQGYVEAAAIK